MRALIIFIGLLVLGAAAYAQETITYGYDAKGQLTSVNHGTAGPNAGATATYTYDPAGNRTQVAVSGGGAPATCAGVGYAISDASTIEGSSLTFVVTKSGSTSINCSVNYATANGTGVAGTDYTATSGTLTFTATQTSANINVATVNHNRLSGTVKTMFVNLSSPTGGATITDSQGQGSINGSGSCGRGC